jgi:hypothetical protein
MSSGWAYFVAASFMACTTAPSRDVKVVSPEGTSAPSAEAPEPTSAPSAAAWPDRSELFIVLTDQRDLELRAFGTAGLKPFKHVIGGDVQQTVYNPELGLFWFLDAERLWVLDLYEVGAGVAKPVLIASHLPAAAKLYILKDATFQSPGQVGEGSMEMELHWDEEPSITATVSGEEGKQEFHHLDGSAWLSQERSRAPRSAPAWIEFAERGPHAPLPVARARCTDKRQCGAALPFGDRGWQLVISGDEYGDFEHHFCLLYDPATRLFATPPRAAAWADATALESAGCGPYFFNERNDAYFDFEVICRTSGVCAPLDDASAEGWVVPGVGVGAI